MWHKRAVKSWIRWQCARRRWRKQWGTNRRRLFIALCLLSHRDVCCRELWHALYKRDRKNESAAVEGTLEAQQLIGDNMLWVLLESCSAGWRLPVEPQCKAQSQIILIIKCIPRFYFHNPLLVWEHIAMEFPSRKKRFLPIRPPVGFQLMKTMV